MRKKLTIPRIIKIQNIAGLIIRCMFNNGESRILDCEKIFKPWEIGEKRYYKTAKSLIFKAIALVGKNFIRTPEIWNKNSL